MEEDVGEGAGLRCVKESERHKESLAEKRIRKTRGKRQMRGKNKKEKGLAQKYGVVKDATRGCRTIKKKKQVERKNGAKENSENQTRKRAKEKIK